MAFAITAHNCQSLKKDLIVTDLSTRNFQAGINYVAASRVTSLQGLLLEAPFDGQSLYNHAPTEDLHLVFLRSAFTQGRDEDAFR